MDNAPELSLLTGTVSVICEYLKIDQIRTGGHNPRGNLICERVNQSLGSMIRKLNARSRIQTFRHSHTPCLPVCSQRYVQLFQLLPRLGSSSDSTTVEGGRDVDALKDVDQFFEQSIIIDQMELAVRMAEVTRTTTEWHSRMTAENLSQTGYAVDLTKYPIDRKAFIYKPPTQAETIARGRKVKHMDHCIGPGMITKYIGTRSMVVRLNGRNFQRDAGMVLLEKPKVGDNNSTIRDRMIVGAQKFTEEIK
jgi:hypothetical protein